MPYALNILKYLKKKQLKYCIQYKFSQIPAFSNFRKENCEDWRRSLIRHRGGKHKLNKQKNVFVGENT